MSSRSPSRPKSPSAGWKISETKEKRVDDIDYLRRYNVNVSAEGAPCEICRVEGRGRTEKEQWRGLSDKQMMDPPRPYSPRSVTLYTHYIYLGLSAQSSGPEGPSRDRPGAD